MTTEVQVARRLREEYPKARHIFIGHSNGAITAGMLAIQECFSAPAPHFFTNVYGEYTDAILKWALSLKQARTLRRNPPYVTLCRSCAEP